MSEKQSLSVKLKDGVQSLKKHWNTPPDGYFVNYKEFMSLSVGSGSLSFISVIVSWTTIAINIPMMISYFKVSTGFVFLAGIIGSLLGLVRAPILSMIIDNSNSKKGKFKPFLPWTSILTAVSLSLIPFIPEAWVEKSLFNFHLPSMPFFGVVATDIDISLGTLVMFILMQIGTFFFTFLSQCLIGIEQVISPISQERANVSAFKGIIANIPGSIVNVVLPLAAGIFFAASANPMNNIELYRWTFPICGIGGVALVFFIYFGTKERVVVNQDYVAKVKFMDGAKQLFTNKYFWLITIFNIAVGIRGNINIYMWICNYAIAGEKGAFALAICNIVLNNAFLPGMLVGPYLIKKFGKKKVMLMSTVGFTVVAVIQLLVINNPYIILVGIFFQNLFNGLSYVTNIMVPDVLDYQQWKTGKRLEGFWQNCNGFIGTICGFFTTALVPLFMSFGGIGFGDNIDLALQDTAIMQSTFKSITWLGIIASVICIIPFFFYDLSEKQHADYIRALKLRAAVQNYETNCLSAEDIKAVKEVMKFANENNNEFLLSEIKKYNSIDEILNTEISDEEIEDEGVSEVVAK